MNKNDYIANLGLLALGSRLKRLSDACFQECSQFYTEAGIQVDPASFPILHYLANHKESSLVHIAQALGVSHAAISQRIRKLEKDGIIGRRYPKEDKRTCLIALTDDGMQYVGNAAPYWEMIRTSLENCLKEDADRLLHTISRCEEMIASGNFRSALKQNMRQHLADQIDIIPFSTDYAPLFAEMNAEWLERYFYIEPIDEEVLGDPQTHILNDGGEIWFAAKDGKILGCYALLKHDENSFEFSKFAVRPEAQGQQIGQKLLKHAISRAGERGMSKIVLFTHSRLLTACALYRRYGFYDIPDAGATSRYARCDTVMHYDVQKQASQAAA